MSIRSSRSVGFSKVRSTLRLHARGPRSRPRPHGRQIGDAELVAGEQQCGEQARLTVRPEDQGDVDAVHEVCTRVEAAVRRPINPTILTTEEFAASSGFLDTVRNGPVVAVIGDLPWR